MNYDQYNEENSKGNTVKNFGLMLCLAGAVLIPISLMFALGFGIAGMIITAGGSSITKNNKARFEYDRTTFVRQKKDDEWLIK